jgi:cysteine-S-conjugate beta-lyase
MYDFNKIIDRSNTNSYKWNKYGTRDVIPLWVADMDFEVAPAIKTAIQQVADHNVYGYSLHPEELTEVFIKRMKERHHWEIQKEWLIYLPGLVPAIYTSCRAVCKENEAVMTATPIYAHFVDAPKYTNRQVQKVPMKVENGYYSFDFEAIENAITDETKLFLLCNPHNPNGRVYSRTELERLTNICLENNIVICSDEIHCDLVLDKTKSHISIATLNKDIENQSITLLAPSKTFNIAGLGCSMAIIPNEEIRANFMKAKYGMLPYLTPFSGVAALAAYRDADDWLENLLDYLRGNHDYLLNEINAIKGLKMHPLEATYLAWIDVSQSGVQNINEAFEKAGLGIMDASIFSGEGYIRLNFATQRARLEEVVERLKRVF